jgi:hypothetical protein
LQKNEIKISSIAKESSTEMIPIESIKSTDSIDISTGIISVDASLDMQTVRQHNEKDVPKENLKNDQILSKIKKLLKALHIFYNHKGSNSNNAKLPDEIELFGLTLLGQTYLGNFEDRLKNSVRIAQLYLDVSIHLFIFYYWVKLICVF